MELITVLTTQMNYPVVSIYFIMHITSEELHASESKPLCECNVTYQSITALFIGRRLCGNGICFANVAF